MKLKNGEREKLKKEEKYRHWLIRVLSSIADHHRRNRCHRRQSSSIILLLGPHFHPIHLRSASLSSFVHLRFTSLRSSIHRYCSCYNTTPPPPVPPLFLHVDVQDRRCRFKQRPPLRWKAINYLVSIFLIILLI
ncbi:hypothetical protein HN51_069850, partial [Arachis hypogaea]